jgi:hypothetical protein
LVELVGIFDMQGGTGGVVEGFVDFGGVFHGLMSVPEMSFVAG